MKTEGDGAGRDADGGETGRDVAAIALRRRDSHALF